MNLEDIKKNYESFDDDKLIRLATTEVDSLRKEVVPILQDEIKKRGISLKVEQKFPNELVDELHENKKVFYSDKLVHQYKTSNIIEAQFNQKTYFVSNSLKFLQVFAFIILLFFVFKFFLDGSRLIFFLIITFLLIKFLITKLKGDRIVILNKKTVVFSKYPRLGNKFNSVIVLIKTIFNLLDVVEINYKDIAEFYKKEAFFDKGYFVKTKSGKTFRVYLELLSAKDLATFLLILKQKCINSSSIF